MSNDKDVLEKKLEDYNDVFADIINGLLPLDEKIDPCYFMGRHIVHYYNISTA